ncbi:MAG: hydroxymethylbilane synthase [Betaproteobacteria bacterium]|nr:hydroxymethylbilane synthase [Betaproteobacteria bacterium]
MSNPSVSPAPQRIVIATRKSALAMCQARHILSRLAALYPRAAIEILGMTTEGDRRLGASLAKIGGKGLFVKELEEALEQGAADIAVHSMKDVPVSLPRGFTLPAVTEREDARDAFVSGRFREVAALPPGSRVGTSSLRRMSQLRARHPALAVEPLRGNVPTRLRKLDEGQYSAVILAVAGLKRLGLAHRVTAVLSPEESLPAVGQGAIGIECRAGRRDLIAALEPLNHRRTALCVRAERALSRALAGSCNVPLAGFAEIDGESMRLRGFVGAPDGSRCAAAELTGPAEEPEALGLRLAERLRAQGADAILAALENA